MGMMEKMNQQEKEYSQFNLNEPPYFVEVMRDCGLPKNKLLTVTMIRSTTISSTEKIIEVKLLDNEHWYSIFNFKIYIIIKPN